ncbi:hypothetical protein [Brevibacterium senegalense]|nr:hypothetical protein [Brevibacterium senegalense]
MIDGQLDLFDELRALAEAQRPKQDSGDCAEKRTRDEKEEGRTGRVD